MKKILVVGSSNMDMVTGVETMPQKGETIRSRSFDRIPGGKGANQACACAKLGGQCTFLSAVGGDGNGQVLMDSLGTAGVDVALVRRCSKVPTGMAIIMVDIDGENSIVIVPGANAECNDEYISANQQALSETDIVLAQLETPVETVWSLLVEAKKLGKYTILNPAPAPESIPDEVLAALDCITPNETELTAITGMAADSSEEIAKAARVLLKKGVRNVLVTIGARGAMLVSGEECRLYPTYPIKRVDSTAAGDTFNAALAVALSEGKKWDKAICFANAAASISVSRKGAQTSVPTREETDTLMSTLLE